MINHIILTVSDVERSLIFYEAALKPLNIRYFLPYKGEDGHPDLWGFGDGKRAYFWLKQGKADPAAIHWGFDADSNLYDSGLDSMAIMQLLILIEEEFGVALPEGELTRQNFSTVRSVASLVRARTAPSTGG